MNCRYSKMPSSTTASSIDTEQSDSFGMYMIGLSILVSIGVFSLTLIVDYSLKAHKRFTIGILTIVIR